MGRLEDIVARNDARKRMTSRKWLLALIALVFATTILLEMFTDLGTPTVPDRRPRGPATHVEDIKLMSPRPAKPR
jgi:hypothetical protein